MTMSDSEAWAGRSVGAIASNVNRGHGTELSVTVLCDVYFTTMVPMTLIMNY